MTIDLSGVEAKLGRAREHLETLHGKAVFIADGETKLLNEFDQAKHAHKITYEGPTIAIPDLGPVFGDFIHNTRSALDLLVTAILRHNGVRVRRYHSYPFCTTEAGFRESILQRDPSLTALTE